MDKHRSIMFNAEELELAEWVKTNTVLNSIWLTGDYHHHWLPNLTGRQAVMTYRAWMWTHGYSYKKQEQDIQRMYADADPQLLKDYRINYIVIGPDERETWKADPALFLWRYPLVKSSPHFLIFKVN